MVNSFNLYNSFNIKPHHKGSIILIGNFDGLHLGHQKLFTLAKKYKKKHKQVSLLTVIDEQLKSTIVVQQFFGCFMLLLSYFIFSVRKLERQIILNLISALIFIGFINLYLLFSLSGNIILPSIYFIFQIIMQLSFFVILFEQLKRT